MALSSEKPGTPTRRDAPVRQSTSVVQNVRQHTTVSTCRTTAPSHASLARQVGLPRITTRQENSTVQPNGRPRGRNRAPGCSAPPQGGTVGPRIQLSRDTIIPGLRVKDFKLGMIVTTPHFAPSFDESIRAGHDQRTESKLGPISIKFRHFIVLAKFHYHFQACPMFSHSDRGIANKPKPLQAEYMGIKRSDDNTFINHTPYPALKVHEIGFDLLGSSNIHVSNTISISYDAQIQFDGCITKDSYQLLARTYQDLLNEKLSEETGGSIVGFPALQQPPSQHGRSVATSTFEDYALPSVSQQIPDRPECMPNGQPWPTPTKSGYYTRDGKEMVTWRASDAVSNQTSAVVNGAPAVSSTLR